MSPFYAKGWDKICHLPKVSQWGSSRAGIQTQGHLIPTLNNCVILDIPSTWSHAYDHKELAPPLSF